MIGVINVEIQAANPQMPLYPIRAFVNSPSSVRIKNVPTEIGAWRITSVRIVAAYPDSSVKTADCVLAGNLWVATIAGCAVSGKSENGFTVFANGVDENGGNVSNYILGKGSIEILKADGSLDPDAPSYYVHLLEEQPTTPNEGDLWPTENGYVIWQDGEAHALGGGSSVTVDAALSGSSTNPVQNKVVTAALNGKTDKVANATSGNFAGLDANGNLTDSGKKAADFATPSEVESAITMISAAMEAALVGKENVSNRVVSISAQSTDVQYPSAKCVYDGLANKADATSLPYALVDIPVSSTAYAPQALFPIKFEGTQIPFEIEYGDQNLSIAAQGGGYVLSWQSGYNWAVATFDGNGNFVQEGSDVDSGTLRFGADEHAPTSADRIVPPNTAPLTDRAINAVSLSAAATLAMPAVSVAGHARDLVVRLTVGADGLNITWGTADAGGVAVDYETEDGEFPDLSEAGTYLVRLTETAAFEAGTGGATDVPAKFLIQCQSLQTAAAGGGV